MGSSVRVVSWGRHPNAPRGGGTRRRIGRLALLVVIGVLVLLGLHSRPARGEPSWTAGVRGALLAEGPTESVHRGFDGQLFVDRDGSGAVVGGAEFGWLKDPGGKTTPRDELSLYYGGPHARFRLTEAVIPAYVELGALGGRFQRVSALSSARDATGAVVGGFVGAAVRWPLRPGFGVQLDGRFTRVHGPSLPRGDDNVDWWSAGVTLLVWR